MRATVTAVRRWAGWTRRHRRYRKPQSEPCSRPDDVDDQRIPPDPRSYIRRTPPNHPESISRPCGGRPRPPTGPRQIPATAPTEAVRCQRCHRCASIENATYRSPDTPADVNRGFGFSALDHVVHKPNHRLVQFDAESDEDE